MSRSEFCPGSLSLRVAQDFAAGRRSRQIARRCAGASRSARAAATGASPPCSCPGSRVRRRRPRCGRRLRALAPSLGSPSRCHEARPDISVRICSRKANSSITVTSAMMIHAQVSPNGLIQPNMSLLRGYVLVLLLAWEFGLQAELAYSGGGGSLHLLRSLRASGRRIRAARRRVPPAIQPSARRYAFPLIPPSISLHRLQPKLWPSFVIRTS